MKQKISNQFILKTKFAVKIIYLDSIENLILNTKNASYVMIDLYYTSGRNVEIRYNYSTYKIYAAELVSLVKKDYYSIVNALTKYNNNKLHISSTYEK